MAIYSELKRRNVLRVSLAYLVVAWLIMQVGDTLAPALLLPAWAISLLAFLLILGFPVGFVGAAESKAELADDPRGCQFVALRGRRGGSAMASAAVNALAAGLPVARA